MFRFVSRAVLTARKSSCVLCELRLSPRDEATAQVPRTPSGPFSSGPARLCVNKDHISTATREEKTSGEAEETEAPLLLEKEAQNVTDDTNAKAEEQVKEEAAVKTDGGNAAQKTDVTVGQDAEKMTGATAAPARTGKESLLDLLGAMKVEVTNKRKLKKPQVKPSLGTPVSKPAEMESTISMFQRATEEAASHSPSLDPELVAAASAAASTLPDRSQAESELLMQLRRHEAVAEAQKRADVSDLGVLIADMKVGKNPNRLGSRPANQIRFDDDGRGYTHDRGITGELDGVRRKRSLFSGKRLNLFSAPTQEDVANAAVERPTLWDLDFADRLSKAVSRAPRNGLEEMIQWTREGKLWRYPVNNEAGLEEEAGVPFHEHVFLEKHLEEGFPRRGPVRHFMELVVAGLSKNPYLTVRQKKEHISWFRDYFHLKEDVLKEAEVYLE